jgi:hypothetical protein
VAAASDQSIGAGLISRILENFEEGFYAMIRAPFLGWGLGIGTNAGAKYLTGHSTFLLSEGEWTRIFLESGPILGLAYIVWRCAVVVRIGWLCLVSVRANNILPLLLFSAGFLPLINGQFGQPTILGFAVFTTGLALAARNADEPIIKKPARAKTDAPRAKRIVGRRSAYADRLHRSAKRRDQSNGSADR